jgi:hypothetical protein
MKPLGIITFLVVIASSVGSLRGDDRNRRNLADYIYKDYPGVCRKNSNGTGGGSNGVEYDVFKREDNSAVDYYWCKDKCNNQSSCTGFEYRDSGDTSQCEVWKMTIGGYQKKAGHECMVRGDRKHTWDCEYGACRKYSDGSGKGNDGDEYNLIKGGNLDYSSCKRMCSEDMDCKGFEYRWGDDNTKQCELWHTAINSVEQEDKWDLDCCVKNYV